MSREKWLAACRGVPENASELRPGLAWEFCFALMGSGCGDVGTWLVPPGRLSLLYTGAALLKSGLPRSRGRCLLGALAGRFSLSLGQHKGRAPQACVAEQILPVSFSAGQFPSPSFPNTPLMRVFASPLSDLPHLHLSSQAVSSVDTAEHHAVSAGPCFGLPRLKPLCT